MVRVACLVALVAIALIGPLIGCWPETSGEDVPPPGDPRPRLTEAKPLRQWDRVIRPELPLRGEYHSGAFADLSFDLDALPAPWRLEPFKELTFPGTEAPYEPPHFRLSARYDALGFANPATGLRAGVPEQERLFITIQADKGYPPGSDGPYYFPVNPGGAIVDAMGSGPMPVPERYPHLTSMLSGPFPFGEGEEKLLLWRRSQRSSYVASGDDAVFCKVTAYDFDTGRLLGSARDLPNPFDACVIFGPDEQCLIAFRYSQVLTAQLPEIVAAVRGVAEAARE